MPLRENLAIIGRVLPVRTLDRYVMKQFAIAYLICSGSILSLFMVLEGVSRLDKFMDQDSNLIIVVFKYFLATIPVYFSQYLGPVLTLIAAMFAVTLLNKGQELVPMKAAGISVPRIVAPCFFLALGLAAFQIGVQEWVLPNSKDFIRQASAYGKRKSTISPDLVQETRRDGSILYLHVEDYTPHQKRGHFVRVDVSSAQKTFDAIYQAEDLVWETTPGSDDESQGQWVLLNGAYTLWDEDGNPKLDGDGVSARTFEREPLETSIRPIDLEASDREIPFLSYGELLDQYRRRPQLNHLEVKLHQRFAFPLANVILLLLGLPFVLKGENRSVIAGVGMAIGIAAAYLLSTTVCADLGNKGILLPAVAAWLPVLFFGALGFTLFDGVDN